MIFGDFGVFSCVIAPVWALWWFLVTFGFLLYFWWFWVWFLGVCECLFRFGFLDILCFLGLGCLRFRGFELWPAFGLIVCRLFCVCFWDLPSDLIFSCVDSDRF